MLDGCRLDEASSQAASSPSTLTADASDSAGEIVDDVMDDQLEEVCQNLEFLLHSDDSKAKALYAKFKEGFKDKFSGMTCKVGYVSIKNLHPTQNTIFLAKSVKPMLDGSWRDKYHGGQPVVKSLLDKHDSKEMKLGYLVVCSVGGTSYLIDGHHRWSKAYMVNPSSKLYAYVLPSDGIFKSEDDVLKFAQCEIALYLGRNNQSNHPVNTGANKADDINIYEASNEAIKQKVDEFLTGEVVKIFADKSNVLGGKASTREKIAEYVASNKDVMVKNAPAGVHDRTYMPQYPDGNGPGEALKKVNESETSASLPIADLGDVLRLDGCQKQKDMCWGYEGFVLVHKSTNPDFDGQKPYVVVMRQDDVPRMKDFWQLHFVNFKAKANDPSVLDSLYKALAASCKAGMGLCLAGHCTPGGISALNQLKNYGFKKKWLPYGFPVEWESGNGSDLDQGKLEKWLKSGKHDDEFLVVIWDPELQRHVDARTSKLSPEELRAVRADDTRPRPFQMVRNQTVLKEGRKMKKRYSKKQIAEAISHWEKVLKEGEDTFFSQKTCDRCHGPLSGGRTMSMYNTDCICMKCAKEERQRKDYKQARDAEASAVKRGDRNFKGIGFNEDGELGSKAYSKKQIAEAIAYWEKQLSKLDESI